MRGMRRLSLSLALYASGALAQDATRRVVVGASAVQLVTTSSTARVLADPGLRVVWEGPTTWQGEDRGLRTRDALSLSDGTIVRERYDEAASLCGMGELPSERWALGPSLRFVRAPNLRLLSAARSAFAGAASTPSSVVAGAPPSLPLRGAVVRLSEGSAPAARALEDGDPRSAQTLTAGSSVTLRPSLGPVSLRALELTAPPSGELPRRWLLTMDTGAPLAVTLPSTRSPGRLRVMLPEGARPSCVALVALDDGAVAELGWMTSLDASGDGGIAALLAAAEGVDGDAALRLALSLGERGERAVIEALPTMSVLAARRAVRALAATGRAEAITAVARALARDEVAAAAQEALEGVGAPAIAGVASVVAEVPRALRVVAGMRLSWAVRLGAAVPLLGAPDEAWREGLPTLRAMLSAAARENSARPWVEGLPTSEPARSRGLRVLAEAMGVDDPVMALAAERARSQWETATEFATRWRLLSPMAGDAQGRAALGELLAGRGPGASDADLRSEAARALGRFPDATDALRGGLGDAVPRVRAASATALRGRGAAVDALRTVLADDRWPTVRAAAAAALAPRPEAADALASALDARSVLVVRAALRALSENPATTVTARLVAFAQDGSRASLLRREAIDAAATRCDAGALAGLEALAETLGDTALPAYEQDLGHAALAAMAHIDAGRARAFLQRSEANPAARAAVERAARGGCSGR
jgi:hypothetical protein